MAWQLQEAGRRAGTENVLGIVGLGAAAEVVRAEQEATARHMAIMRDDLQDRLLCAFPQVLPELVALHAEYVEETDWYVCCCCCLFLMDAIILNVHCSMCLAEVLRGS